jgi:hypothetical protein
MRTLFTIIVGLLAVWFLIGLHANLQAFGLL